MFRALVEVCVCVRAREREREREREVRTDPPRPARLARAGGGGEGVARRRILVCSEPRARPGPVLPLNYRHVLFYRAHWSYRRPAGRASRSRRRRGKDTGGGVPCRVGRDKGTRQGDVTRGRDKGTRQGDAVLRVAEAGHAGWAGPSYLCVCVCVCGSGSGSGSRRGRPRRLRCAGFYKLR